MRLVPLLLILILWITNVHSEVPQYRDVLVHNAATSIEDGTSVNVHNANVVRVDVQITGTATVSFNIAGAGNYGWHLKLCTPSDSSSATSQATQSGVFYCSVAGGNVFQAPITDYTSGTVTVVARVTTAF